MNTKVSPRGFTLVELLVVIGIIALLISILLPVLARAREEARLTACLSNVRQLAMGVQLYRTDNVDVTPNGDFGNWSPLATDRWDRAQLSPVARSATVGAIGSGFFAGSGAAVKFNTIAPTPLLLNKYVGTSKQKVIGTVTIEDVSESPWKCPSAGEGSGGRLKFFENKGLGLEGSNFRDDYWRPTYSYMSTRGYTDLSVCGNATDDLWRGGDWQVRNIANLRGSTIRTIKGQGPSQVVAFREFAFYYHNSDPGDIYNIPANTKPIYRSNMAYLDGHGDRAQFGTVNELFNNYMHEPITQSQFNRDWNTLFPNYYKLYANRGYP